MEQIGAMSMVYKDGQLIAIKNVSSELVVVGNNGLNAQSIYQQVGSGLYLPPNVTYMSQSWLQNQAYPEFAAAIVKELDKPVVSAISKHMIQQYSTNLNQQAKLYAQFKKTMVSQKQLHTIVPGMIQPLVDIIRCPGYTNNQPCGLRVHNVGDGIVHLNDDHKWPREKIANWLDTLTGVDLRVKKVA